MDDFADRQHGGYDDYRPCTGPREAKPRRATCEMRLSYSEFRALGRRDGGAADARYYLQTPLMLAAEPPYAAQVIAGHAMQLAAVGDGLRDDLLRGIAAARVAALVAAGGLGRFTRMQFFASDRGAVSQLHYDQYANLFVQVAGHKRFALVAPDGARALRPFPVHHPLDAYARADLDLEEAGASRAREVVLGPGEMLYIPSHWWHHVQTLDDGCVSINFWFSIEHLLVAPPPRLSAPLQLELARQAEYLVADTLGPSAVGPFFWHVERELAEADEPRGSADEPEPPPWLELQNYFILQLGRVIGPAHVPGFVRCYLPYSRFEGLGRQVRSCLSDFK